MRSIAVFSLFTLAAGAQLYTDQSVHEAIMRRQTSDASLAGDSVSTPEILEAPRRDRPSKKKRNNACQYRYVLGDTGNADCTSKSNTRAVEGDAKCRLYAQDDAGSSFSDDLLLNPFVLTNASGDFVIYPWRCFKTGDNPPKYGFNPSGLAPTNVGSAHMPICEEVTYINGTEDTNECGNSDYEAIMTEDACRTAVQCEDLYAHHNFRDAVLNATEAAAAPKGCHIEADGGVRFSNSTAGCASGSCHGIPMCSLTTAAQGIAGTTSTSLFQREYLRGLGALHTVES